MNLDPRIGLIIPSSNRLTEAQFHQYAPAEVGIHVTRLRMTGPWRKPLNELKETVSEAARVLSDAKPGIIVFHCTASSMEEGLSGELALVEWMRDATGRAAITTGQAVAEALTHLGLKKIVLLSPYVKITNQHEVSYLREAGFEVIHEMGLELKGSDEYIAVTPRQWRDITRENHRPEADGYFLSCTNTRTIEVIEELEDLLGRPVITSNQATLWSCLRKLRVSRTIAGLGRLFDRS